MDPVLVLSSSVVRALACKARDWVQVLVQDRISLFQFLQLANRWPWSENWIFNITSVSGHNIKNPLINGHFILCDCMPL